MLAGDPKQLGPDADVVPVDHRVSPRIHNSLEQRSLAEAVVVAIRKSRIIILPATKG